jgi:hypothetical protein
MAWQAVVWVLATFLLVRAESLALSTVFQSHMVLQRGQPNVVWGWGAAGAGGIITVTLGNESVGEYGRTHCMQWPMQSTMQRPTQPFESHMPLHQSTSDAALLFLRICLTSADQHRSHRVERAHVRRCHIRARRSLHCDVCTTASVGHWSEALRGGGWDSGSDARRCGVWRCVFVFWPEQYRRPRSMSVCCFPLNAPCMHTHTKARTFGQAMTCSA